MIPIHHHPTLEGETYVFDRVRQVSTCTATPRTDAIAVHSTDSGELFARSYRALSSVTFLVDRYSRPADSDEPPPIADTPEGLAELGWSFVITFDAHDCVVLGEDHMPIPLGPAMRQERHPRCQDGEPGSRNRRLFHDPRECEVRPAAQSQGVAGRGDRVMNARKAPAVHCHAADVDRAFKRARAAARTIVAAVRVPFDEAACQAFVTIPRLGSLAAPAILERLARARDPELRHALICMLQHAWPEPALADVLPLIRLADTAGDVRLARLADAVARRLVDGRADEELATMLPGTAPRARGKGHWADELNRFNRLYGDVASTREFGVGSWAGMEWAAHGADRTDMRNLEAVVREVEVAGEGWFLAENDPEGRPCGVRLVNALRPETRGDEAAPAEFWREALSPIEFESPPDVNALSRDERFVRGFVSGSSHFWERLREDLGPDEPGPSPAEAA